MTRQRWNKIEAALQLEPPLTQTSAQIFWDLPYFALIESNNMMNPTMHPIYSNEECPFYSSEVLQTVHS